MFRPEDSNQLANLVLINLKSGKHGLANGLSANKDNISEGVQAVYDSTST